MVRSTFLLCFIDAFMVLSCMVLLNATIDAGDRVRVRFEGDVMYDGFVRQVSITGQKLRVRFDDTEVSWQDRVDITELLPPVEDTTVDDAHASTFTNNS